MLFLLTGPLTMRPHFLLLVPSPFYLHTLTSLLLFVRSRLIPPSSFCTCCSHASVPKYASDLLSTAFRFLLNRHVISESLSEQVIEEQIYNSKSPLPQHSFIRVYFANIWYFIYLLLCLWSLFPQGCKLQECRNM